mmetsp:Transcript_34428/g.56268  ORF Transcript_34428/g.56268 Transcript_34428/m.56268 type:complete len:116 (-) Transcript_34428:177-524(-)
MEPLTQYENDIVKFDAMYLYQNATSSFINQILEMHCAVSLVRGIVNLFFKHIILPNTFLHKQYVSQLLRPILSLSNSKHLIEPYHSAGDFCTYIGVVQRILLRESQSVYGVISSQ